MVFLPSGSFRSGSFPPTHLPAATGFPVPQSVPCAWRKTPEPRLPLSDLPASACSAALCYDEPTKIKECKGSGRHQMSLYDIKFLIFGIKKRNSTQSAAKKGQSWQKACSIPTRHPAALFWEQVRMIQICIFLISILYSSFTHPLPPFAWPGKLWTFSFGLSFYTHPNSKVC